MSKHAVWTVLYILCIEKKTFIRVQEKQNKPLNRRNLSVVFKGTFIKDGLLLKLVNKSYYVYVCLRFCDYACKLIEILNPIQMLGNGIFKEPSNGIYVLVPAEFGIFTE